MNKPSFVELRMVDVERRGVVVLEGKVIKATLWASASLITRYFILILDMSGSCFGDWTFW